MVGKVDAAKPDLPSMSTTFSFKNLKLNEATRVVDPSHNPYFNYQTTLYLTEKGFYESYGHRRHHLLDAQILWFAVHIREVWLKDVFSAEVISVEEYLQQVRDGNGFCCLRSSER
ncbi:hypothetical protein L1887_27585 [Cichorium endivia]|nr:hypothetical protein L1887_27585 [Cichorium endivia]